MHAPSRVLDISAVSTWHAYRPHANSMTVHHSSVFTSFLKSPPQTDYLAMNIAVIGLQTLWILPGELQCFYVCMLHSPVLGQISSYLFITLHCGFHLYHWTQPKL